MYDFHTKNKHPKRKVVIFMDVFLYEKKNKEGQNEDAFQKELRCFADDYGLTIEEAVAILANMAAKQMKEAILADSNPFASV